MSDTFSTISYALAAGSIGFALAMALSRPDPRRDRVLFFSLVLLALLVHALGQLLILSGAFRFAPHLVGLDLSLKMALGPAVYFYTRALVSPEAPCFGGRDWTAMVGPVLVILVSLPFAALSAEEKLALVDPATRNPDHFRIALFTCTASLLLFLTFTAVYIVAAVRLQKRHRRQMMQELANIERQSLDWLRTILIVFAGAWLFFAIKQALWLSGMSIPAFNAALAFTEMLAIAAFAFLGLNQPSLHIEPAPKPDTAPRRPILTEERMRRTATKLRDALGKNGLYAENDLSLRKLSDITGVTKNHISETLSQHLGVNFFDFVNSHRAEAAKRLLSQTDLGILEISLEVGFNSRSTFNVAFKKHVGLPPSRFREAPGQAPADTGRHSQKEPMSVSE
ncbi:helix-turn-helix transcriptional regulator [uncultured Maricaulis sp.]|uniref:helix-turn-helix domain-containing protein n=1 Tax=uncultured Maricaulis sp. TaxID=174710 RepID=UPI002624B079|nr:helix-turn-helix transcriptional regulator [uncultured Maricaulis sp.]